MITLTRASKNFDTVIYISYDLHTTTTMAPAMHPPNPPCPKCLKLVYAAEQIMGPGRKVQCHEYITKSAYSYSQNVYILFCTSAAQPYVTLRLLLPMYVISKDQAL